MGYEPAIKINRIELETGDKFLMYIVRPSLKTTRPIKLSTEFVYWCSE